MGEEVNGVAQMDFEPMMYASDRETGRNSRTMQVWKNTETNTQAWHRVGSQMVPGLWEPSKETEGPRIEGRVGELRLSLYSRWQERLRSSWGL